MKFEINTIAGTQDFSPYIRNRFADIVNHFTHINADSADFDINAVCADITKHCENMTEVSLDMTLASVKDFDSAVSAQYTVYSFDYDINKADFVLNTRFVYVKAKSLHSDIFAEFDKFFDTVCIAHKAGKLPSRSQIKANILPHLHKAVNIQTLCCGFEWFFSAQAKRTKKGGKVVSDYIRFCDALLETVRTLEFTDGNFEFTVKR